MVQILTKPQGDVAYAKLASEFHDSFAGKGSVPLAVADSGGTYTKVDAGGAGDGLSIIGGKLTNTATHAGTGAGYAQQQLSGNVRRIGCRFVFAAGGTAGVLNIAIWKTSITGWPTIPDSPLHLGFGPLGYGISTWTGNASTNLAPASGVFPWRTAMVQDGATVYEIEAVIDEDNNIYVYPPDGIVDGPFTSAAVAANLGAYTNHEVFQSNASSDAKGSFVEAWADTKVAA